ncbi:MAG TPA: hypothetical protein VFG71_03390 [Nitrospiraceae bacterium]|nr:hypothetical protein [Nitrospiraceae bacterium]
MKSLAAVVVGSAELFMGGQVTPTCSQSGASSGQSGDQPGSSSTNVPVRPGNESAG